MSVTELSLPGTVWVASDIHLARQVPETCRVFYDFLRQATVHADALILAGDIFDAWIGDDVALHDPEPWLAQALQHLAATARAIPLYLGRGNRDFLMSTGLANRLSAHMLDESTLLRTDAGLVHVSHGDELCTHDIGFQRFRKIVHHRLTQGAFLALPLAIRKAIARRARKTSMHSHGTKPMYLMDVAHDAVSEVFARHPGLTQVVHGHTHKPKHHQFPEHDNTRHRWVLPDWEFDSEPRRGGYLAIDASGLSLHAFPGENPSTATNKGNAAARLARVAPQDAPGD